MEVIIRSTNRRLSIDHYSDLVRLESWDLFGIGDKWASLDGFHLILVNLD
jgi:hypothetical protein